MGTKYRLFHTTAADLGAIVPGFHGWHAGSARPILIAWSTSLAVVLPKPSSVGSTSCQRSWKAPDMRENMQARVSLHRTTLMLTILTLAIFETVVRTSATAWIMY